MTEDEAREKWCPYSYTSANRDKDEYFTRCIASDCMMWRWKDTVINNPQHPDEYRRIYEKGY